VDQKRYEEAIGQLKHLQQEYPKEDEIRYTLAEAYEKAGALPEAEKVLTDLAARPTEKRTPDAPLSARPALALAGLYERAGKLEDAAGSFENALRAEPTSMVALQGLSRVRQQQKKPEAAAAFVEDLALSDSATPLLPAVGAVRQLYLQNKAFDKYLAFTKRLVDKYPEVRDARYIRARSLTEDMPEHKPSEAERTEAVDLYRKIVVRNPNDVIVQLQLAQQLEALGKKEEAIAAYKAMLKVSPQNTEAQTALHRLGATASAPVAPAPPPLKEGASGGR
jgi:tetratricopeptide (TPR) repeat protein